MIELPFGAEFSPNQISLPRVLELAKEHEGNNEAIDNAILEEYFLKENYNKGDFKNQHTLADNCRLGMKSYKILNEDGTFTDLGNTLYELRNDEQKLYEAFGKHILLNLYGLTFVESLYDEYLAGEKVTLDNMESKLELRGITYPNGGRHPSSFRLWLSKAGVFQESRSGPKVNVPNMNRVNEILGMEEDVYPSLSMLSIEQRYFLLALLNTGITEFQSGSKIRKLASASYGVTFKTKSLPKSVLNDIEREGFIETQKATGGRGSKSHLVKPTKKAIKEILEPIIEQLKEQTDPRLVRLLRKSISDILEEIKSKDTHVKGLALEALGFKIMTILGLKYIGSRVRSATTGGQEVDLLFYSDHPVYSLWQIQCKNKESVSNEIIAREVGLSDSLFSNIIVIITTGGFTPSAVNFSNDIMRKSNLAIILIDRDDIKRIAKDPTSIVDILQQQSKEIRRIKSNNSAVESKPKEE